MARRANPNAMSPSDHVPRSSGPRWRSRFRHTGSLAAAVEIAKRDDDAPGLTFEHPWLVAFGFGLIHGFGFAGALREMGLPAGSEGWPLMYFNLGVELGQLLFLASIGLAVLGVRGLAGGRWRQWSARLVPTANYVLGTASVFWLFQRWTEWW